MKQAAVVCPSCDHPLQEEEVQVCTRCNAVFGPGSRWSPLRKHVVPPKPHVPNEVSLWNRFWYVALAIGCLAYVAFAIHAGEIYVPGKRGRSFTLRGPAAWVMGIALVFGAAHLAAYVLDHYDRRDNERSYAAFSRRSRYAVLALAFLSVFMPAKW